MGVRDIHHNNFDGLPLAVVFAKGDENQEELSYFRPIPIDDFGNLLPAINRIYRDLTSLNIELIDVEVGGNFTQWYEGYTDGRFDQRCDKVNRVKWRGDDGSLHRGKLPCLETKETSCNCQLKARLHFMLPEVESVTGVVARYMITSGSRNDVRHILSALNQFKRIYEPLGYALNQIPMIVSRQLTTIDHPDGKGGFGQSQHYLINLIVDPDFVRRVRRGRVGKTVSTSNYRIHIEQMFERHIPDHTLFDFCLHHGHNPDTFFDEYPDIVEIRKMVMDWLYDAGIPVRLTRVKCQQKSSQYRYIVTTGFVDVTMYSSRLFKELGVDVTPFWRKHGAIYHFDDNIFARLGKTKTKGHLTVDSLVRDMVKE